MDLDSFLRDPQSRRRFFRMSGVAVAGSSAIFLSACGDDASTPSPTGPDESDEADVEILNSALDLELMAVAAYKAGAAQAQGRRPEGRQAVPRAGAGARRRPHRGDQGRRRHAEPRQGLLRLPRAEHADRRAALRRRPREHRDRRLHRRAAQARQGRPARDRRGDRRQRGRARLGPARRARRGPGPVAFVVGRAA